MLVYITKRILLSLCVALVVSFLSFGLIFLSGDPATAIAGESATGADILLIRKAYGLDRPIVIQYISWLEKAACGDFGKSFYFDLPVSQVIKDKIPVTIQLGIMSLCFALIFSIPLGILASIRPNSWVDRLALTLSVIGQALPSFWFSLILMVVFAFWWPVLPASGSETWAHFVLPTVVLGYYAMPAFMRLTRAGMLEVLDSDYIRTAKAKGLLSHQILFKHALRNALIPVVSMAAVQFGFMLGGSVVIETVFALQGMGFLAWESVMRSDFPTVQAIILILSLIYIVLTLLSDILNAWLDPRIRVA